MRKRAATLIELVTVFVLLSILALSTTLVFLASEIFKKKITEQNVVWFDTDIAMSHMTMSLRFALSSPAPAFTNTTSRNTITATIEKGHISRIPTTNTSVQYYWTKADNKFWYKQGTAAAIQLAENVTDFTVDLNELANKEFTINLKASKNGKTIAVRTKIHSLS